ncbi:glycosyltransferase [Vibrio fluvialis]|uniref:glycosyltransferase n=1 Tax=Vibrio fluvialis TaxID=676 RepID=UPI002ACA3E98|nr:glycosyltransferase [Vibrio fluvialis]MDZ5516278.1 glycosyltransferase [Vibrio fluvialis]
MKVLHLLSGELNSGASRGALWLHNALKESGCDSTLFIDSLYSKGQDGVYLNYKKLDKINKVLRTNINRLPDILYGNKMNTLFSHNIVGKRISKMQCYKDADIINLHWINDGFLNLDELKKIDKPIVWTLRDMWPLTGGCHYALDCNNYKNKCQNCPQLGSAFKYDISSYYQNKKLNLMQACNVTPVGISRWISDCARDSSIFKNSKIKYIGNVIDTELFKPIEKNIAKEVLGVKDKKVISIGAQKIDDFYKGMNEFLLAINEIKNKKDLHILFFGNFNSSIFDSLGVEYTSFGFVNDSLTLQLIYSASDVFVAPSKMEAFGKTIGEAMACNTPVVAFNFSGPIDLIDHLDNGYLATPFSYEDLAKGIEYILYTKDFNSACVSPRKKIVDNFSPKIIAEKYMDLYESLL